MDLVEGGEVFDHLVRNGAYSERDASRLVREVGSALAFLHGIGLVHGDLKPENLMLSSRNPSDATMKVVDFGCAEIIDEDSPYYDPDRTPLGALTPGYSPPEVLERSAADSADYAAKKAEPSSDMFSMGVILYVMLTGVHPFDVTADSTDDRMNRRILNRVDPPLRGSAIAAHLSPSAIDLIERLMAWDPTARMTAPEMLNHPWVRGETAATGKIADSEKRLKAFFRRHRSGLEAEVFSSMVRFSDDRHRNRVRGDCGNDPEDDAARKTSLIERSFQRIDSENRGYITTSDLRKIASRQRRRPNDDGGGGEEEDQDDDHDGGGGDSRRQRQRLQQQQQKLSLSGFSELLSKNMKNVYLLAGHIVFREGDEGDSMYFLNSGRVEVTTESGFRAVTDQGDFFGEGALLSGKKNNNNNKKDVDGGGGNRRTATVTCVTPVHAIRIDRSCFEKYVDGGGGEVEDGEVEGAFDEIELALVERDRLRRQERA